MRIYEGGKFPNIDRWLRENRITVTELARRMGVSSPTVWRELKGKNVPGLYNIKALLRVTGMTFAEAFREEEP